MCRQAATWPLSPRLSMVQWRGHFPGLLCGWPGVNNPNECKCLAKGPSTCRQEGSSGIRKPSETLTDKPGWSDNWRGNPARFPADSLSPRQTLGLLALAIPLVPPLAWHPVQIYPDPREPSWCQRGTREALPSPSWVPPHHTGHGPGPCWLCWLPGSWVLSCGATGSGCVRVSGWCTCGLYPRFGTHICSLAATQPESPQSP